MDVTMASDAPGGRYCCGEGCSRALVLARILVIMIAVCSFCRDRV